ncbi:MAG: V-type ATP synthase subunit F [Rectinemataceae bacterium]
MAGIFVVAEEEIVLAFRMAGVDGRAASGRDEALDAFRKATGELSGGETIKVLILTEEVADLLEEEVKAWQMSGAYPLIVEVPGQGSRSGDRKSIVDAIREAIGVMI